MQLVDRQGKGSRQGKMSGRQVLVLADDLTGALEVGAKFAGHGIAAVVTTELSLQPAGVHEGTHVLVIDTESRHLTCPEAADRVRRLALAARQEGVRYIYKKTDSTLRGNIGSELGALSAAYPDAPIVYVPAYPQMGRTVKQGRLYVDNRPVSETAFAADRLNPIRESYIPAVLAGQSPLPILSVTVEALGAISTPAIYVCDGETDADLLAAARVFLESNMLRLAAGPAGFAEFLAQMVEWPRSEPGRWPRVENCLVVNGSLHEISLGQVRRAVDEGWRVVEPSAVSKAIAESRWLILKAGGEAESPLRLAERLGEMVRDILRRVELDALVTFGGDTAYGILQAIGSPHIHPMGELIPGVPLSTVDWQMLRANIGERKRDLCLATKAGGFGPVDILSSIRRSLTRDT